MNYAAEINSSENLLQGEFGYGGDLCTKHNPKTEWLPYLDMAKDGLLLPRDLSCPVAVRGRHVGGRHLQSSPLYEASLVTLE